MRSAYFGGAAVAGVVLARTAAVVGAAAMVASPFTALIAVMLHPAVVSGDLGVITTLLIDVPSPIQATKARAVMRPMFPPFNDIHVYIWYFCTLYLHPPKKIKIKNCYYIPSQTPFKGFFGWLYFFEKYTNNLQNVTLHCKKHVYFCSTFNCWTGEEHIIWRKHIGKLWTKGTFDKILIK